MDRNPFERQVIKGIPASFGVAKAPLAIWQEEILAVPGYPVENPQEEIGRLTQARHQSACEIAVLKAKAIQEIGVAEGDVFEAHTMLLEDLELVGMAEAAIYAHQNAERAWMAAVDYFAKALASLPDPTFQQRAADVHDIGRRVLAHLIGRPIQAGLTLSQAAIIVAYDLTPSQTSLLDRRLVKGFCTATGGPTSHTAILAKALGIPAIVGLGEGVMILPAGVEAMIDGERGELIVAPDGEDEMTFHEREHLLTGSSQRELAFAIEPAHTADGRRVEVVANIGSRDEASLALQSGAEGVGLFRTEFLFLDRQNKPDEEELYRAYAAVLDVMGTRPVVIRTLDAGGDKVIPYLNAKPEANPFLGWRAIRICLACPELFKQQLRALLRAGDGHDLRIMFPMIATLDEVRQARALVEACQAELHHIGLPYATTPQVGVMAEIPSVIVMADQFAREVDFFSVGTNDLTQYTMAAERTNEKVAHLGDACHPAIFRQIDRLVRAAHAQQKWVGVCGELAGDYTAIPILIGLGVDELSMSPGQIPHAKAVIRSLRCDQVEALATSVLDLPDAWSVRQAVQKRLFL